MKKTALVVFYVLSVLLATGISAHFTKKNQMAAFGRALETMQSELSLRHLLRYSELESDLEKDCKAAVLEKLKISVAVESEMLASTLEHQKTDELAKYIAKQ